MIKPSVLKKGDTVAVVSLSSGMAGEPLFLSRFEKGCQRLREVFGLQVKIMPHALLGIDYLYRHPEARAKDLMDAFSDTEVKAIICAIGGDDTLRLLPYIDYEVIRNNPKIFMGYSDSTANHFMMYKAGLVSFHGPCVLVELAENITMHAYTVHHLQKVLFEPCGRLQIQPSPVWTSQFLDWAEPSNSLIPRTLTEDPRGFELLQGSDTVSGPLLGGNATLLQMIIGTEIWPNKEEWSGKILFLETGEDYPAPDILRFFLRNLTAQGIFAAINGILVGKPLDEKYYEEYKEVYRSVVGFEAGFPSLPILYNVNCSHTAPICILPYGVRAEIDCKKRALTLLEPAVTSL